MAALQKVAAALAAAVAAAAPGPSANNLHLPALPPAVPQGVTVLQTDLYCDTQYGTQPQQVVPGATDVAQGGYCLPGVPSQLLYFTDNTGTNRTACFYPNPLASPSNPLPLVTWLHPSLTTVRAIYVTGLLQEMYSAGLNNENSAAVGYHLLTPGGLFGSHEYPGYDRVGLGWDNWYRNFNRSSPTLNADVETIDFFINEVKATGLVDTRRQYMSGWSNGASMAEQYAQITSTIAAAAVYSAPDPFRDAGDRCAQIPLPTFATPTLDVHNYCDLIGICTTGKYYRDDLSYRYPNKATNLTVISSSVAAPVVLGSDASAKCDPQCTPFAARANATANAEGSAAHGRWPVALNSLFLNYFLQHPLPKSGSWPRLNPDGVTSKNYYNIITGTF